MELHNRGSFAQGLKSNGVHVTSRTKGPRADWTRRGIIKNMVKAAIKDHHTIGKDQVKQCASIAQVIKNDSMRQGGVRLSQWVLAKALQRQVSLAEEDEWGQLGVPTAQQESTTVFGFKARLRMSMQTAFARMDCGRRYAPAMIRKARRWTTTGLLVTSQCTRFIGTSDHPGEGALVQHALFSVLTVM